MNKGKHAGKVTGVILFGFSDNVGYQARYKKQKGKDYHAEAEGLMRDGKPYHLLSDLDGYCGESPVSAQTYIDTFHEDSEDAKALPLHKGQGLPFFYKVLMYICLISIKNYKLSYFGTLYLVITQCVKSG